MAEEDIYGSKRRYERFIADLDTFREPPKEKAKKGNTRKYYCRNPKNLKYFRQLHSIFESRDTSYIRRLRVFKPLEVATYFTEKDLSVCTREDIDAIVAFGHKVNKSPKSKGDFIKDIKFI